MTLDMAQVPIWYLEQAINDIFPGLAMLARDVNLDEQAEALYQVGAILREPSFVDASQRFMGMCTTHRITILSNHMVDVTPYLDDPEAKAWGLCMAQRNSHFKVLDAHELDGKKQILLLHLPDDERWKLFDKVVLSSEENLIIDSRRRFENKCNESVVPELATQRWIERTSFPIGFDDDLHPWPLEVPIEERLKKLGEIDFRAIDQNVFLIKDMQSAFPGIEGFEDATYPNALAFFYIDDEQGLSAQLLCDARIVNDTIERGQSYEGLMMILRMDGCEEVEIAQVVDETLALFAGRITSIHDNYAPSEDVAKIREIRVLDRFRYPTSPDDISAILVTGSEGSYQEQVWLKTKKLEDGLIFATLLNEPQQDLGVHRGDLLQLALAETDDGIQCFALAKSSSIIGDDSPSASTDAAIMDISPKREYVYLELPTSKVSASEYLSSQDDEIKARMSALLKVEAPIEREWLFARVRESFGISRDGTKLSEKNRSVLRSVEHKTTRFNGKTFIWRDDQIPEEYRTFRIAGSGPGRDIEQIPYEELKNSLVYLISQYTTMIKDDLIHEAASLFGAGRCTSRVSSVINNAMHKAMDASELCLDEEGLVCRPVREGDVKLAAGVTVENENRLREGYVIDDVGEVSAFMSLDKLQYCFNYYLASRISSGSKVALFVEIPCHADEEDELRAGGDESLHRKVFYSDDFEAELAMILLNRSKEILFNDGLINFGLLSSDSKSEIGCDGYKVITMHGCPKEDVLQIFELCGVAPATPVTPWDLITPQTPGSRHHVEFEGKTINNVIEDLELKFDHYVKEDGKAIRLKCKRQNTRIFRF